MHSRCLTKLRIIPSMYVIVYIPAYNEEQRIAEVIGSVPKTLPGVDQVGVLVVDDGSTDRTAEVAEAAGAGVLQHGVNQGVGGAFHTALDAALSLGADILVSIDADNQFDSSETGRLITPILEGKADFVTGNRFAAKEKPKNMPSIRYLGNLLMSRIVSTLSSSRPIEDVSCGFRAYSREALLHLNLFGRFTYTQETIMDLAFKGLRIEEVPVTVRYFQTRTSRVARNLPMYGLNTFRIILRTFRDYRPMLFFGSLGLAVFFSGTAMLCFVGIHYIQTGNVSPYKMFGIGGSILIVSGLLIIGLSLLADMLDRMRTTQEKLLYYEKKKIYGKTGGD